MRRTPPDILITTPESLYLILTSQAREMLRGRRVGDRRRDPRRRRDQARRAPRADARAPASAQPTHEVQRIGLSATQNPLEEVGRFLVGPRRTCTDRRRRRAQAAGPEDPRAGRVDGRARRRRRASTSASTGTAARRPAARSGPRSTPSCSSSSASTARRSSSSTTAAAPSASRCASTSWPRRRSPAPTTARWRARSALVVEEMLKAGELPCLVATSSLELGIDMGAVDLVLQVESPKSVARGLQRIGRAGHNVGDISKGRIFPKFRADLLECAVVVKLMREGRDRADRRAAQPARRARPADRRDRRARPSRTPVARRRAVRARHAHALLRRAVARRCWRTCSTCSTAATRRASSASCARASCGTASAGTIRARKGARQLAVTNAGTIPDRGLFSVVLPDGRRVGELDEEMVYEARARPDLPARRLDLAHRGDRPRPRHRHARARRARAPCRSGRATASGRPKELGARDRRVQPLGRRPAGRGARARLRPRRARRAQPRSTSCASSRTPRASCRATARSSSSASATRSATGGCASSRPTAGASTPPGAWRCQRAHPRGASASSPTRSGPTTGSSSTSPTPTSRPARTSCCIDPDELEDAVVAELGASALFGARFRENAAPRAAHPARLPGQAHAAVAAAAEVAVAARGRQALRRLPDHPRDLPRVPARRARPAGADELLRALHRRELSLVEVETPTASPFASSLLFDYVATYMYEGDTPNAERRAAALSLDRDLLRELLGQEELRELIDPGALEQVEADLQHRSERTRADDARRAADVLRRVGDLTDDEVARRACSPGSTPAAMLAELEARAPRRARCASAARSAGSPPTTPACTATRSASSPPGGLPEAFMADVDDALEKLVAPLRAHPRPVHDRRAARALRRRSDQRAARAGARRRARARRAAPGGSEREWCDPEVLRRLRRASLAVLRKEIEAADQRALAALPALAGRASTATRPAAPASTACARCSSRCRASRCPPTSGSATCCRAACGAYSPTWLDQLCACGEVVWVGAGALGRNSRPRRALLPRRRRGHRPAADKAEPPDEPEHELLRERLAQAPCFFTDLLAELADLARGDPGGAVGPRVGGRGDQRRVRAAARAAADARPRPARARPHAARAAASARAAPARRRRSRAAGR